MGTGFTETSDRQSLRTATDGPTDWNYPVLIAVSVSVSASVFWVATGDLVIALFTGNVTDVLIGIYYVGPLVLGLFFSTVVHAG